jgi:hypothetical protein
MDGQGFDSEDELQQLFGNSSRASVADLSGANMEVAVDNDEPIQSQEPEQERPSIFSPDTVVRSRPHTPSPIRPITSPLMSAAPLAALAASSSSTSRRTARFLDQELSMLADSALPQAEKDGDDPSTPMVESPTANREDATPATLTRFLASHSVESPNESSVPTYTLGNGNLVRRCEY